jgi:CRISPR-associated endonuclease Csn1
MSYRLALDLGTNSIGWCALHLDSKNRPCGILGMGVRIFPDGRDAKSQASLAADRRLKRQMRRMRDRYLRRREQFMNALIRHGLMPVSEQERKDLELLDPYALRAKGLDSPLTLHELGRALFHLNQRRGFRSNRRTDKGEDSGKRKPAIQKLRGLMAQAGARSLGEFLHGRRVRGLTVRTRLQGKGAKAGYDFYPERSLVEEEFDALWAEQAKHHSALDGAAKDELKDILFFQRPLKPVDPGRCTFEPGERRAPQALPVAHRFRIFQELNHLRVVSPELAERPLSLAERNLLAEKLLQGKDMSFDAMRRALKLLTARSPSRPRTATSSRAMQRPGCWARRIASARAGRCFRPTAVSAWWTGCWSAKTNPSFWENSCPSGAWIRPGPGRWPTLRCLTAIPVCRARRSI